MKYTIILDNGCGIECALDSVEIEAGEELTIAKLAQLVPNWTLSDGDMIHIQPQSDASVRREGEERDRAFDHFNMEAGA